MPIIETPSPLSVKVPPIDIVNDLDRGYTPTATVFFREYSLLPEALGFAYERAENDEELVIVSAGCSVGAEADSMLALHKLGGNPGRIAMTGVDVNPDMVKAARRGEYYTPTQHWQPVTGTDLYASYEEVGIEVDISRTYPIKGAIKEMDHYKMTVEQLRQGQTIDFVEQDLSKKTVDKEADLITVNNVLYHLQPARATKLMDNLASMLSNRGVISIGDMYDITMGPGYKRFNIMPEITLHAWIFKMMHGLRLKHGLVPIATGRQDQPTVFGRE